MAQSLLALLGGPKAVTREPGDLFRWPIITVEDEAAVLEVLRAGTMSGTDVTEQFEREFAAWAGTRFALAYPNGTEALRGAVWACGLGAGDEMICPAMTYWASATCALTLGAGVHFADCLPDTLCIDPADVERRIGPRTRILMVVHYAGYPCEMDEIVGIARRRGLDVVEDVSHAQGSLYKGRKVGTFGRCAAMSMMSGKGFAVGEGGMLLTDDSDVYERAIAYGHYERTGGATRWSAARAQVTSEELKPFAGIPIGGYKHRINQMCSALGRTQLVHYDARIARIQDAMNRFWDLLDGVPGIRAHRVPAGSGSTMGPWYFPRGLYRPAELGGLPVGRFCEAVRAEGVPDCSPGANAPLHTHPVFHQADIFRQGKPTAVAFGQRDVRQAAGSLPVTEAVPHAVFGVPWFKRDAPALIAEYADAFRKVAEHADELPP